MIKMIINISENKYFFKVKNINFHVLINHKTKNNHFNYC